ncbi:GTP-binding protein typA/bipA [mine drainage metagenome]|uniref:GTP-binding protein typA/bipA n=1 Tax=mine drainage metagenome TaxID=410659 RepID=T0Z3U4_9ZZZZ
MAIVAHVDHGKTTLVDQLLRQSETLAARTILPDRAMDSNELERERGITILAKNTAILWHGHRINIVDTPGHADFGGEVERALAMVDSVLLLVDALDGPMPQTRFVTQKALARGLHPIVVINKMDRPGVRATWVVNQVFDLFDRLGAHESQLDFQVLYTSALNGWASRSIETHGTDLTPLFETLIDCCPPPDVSLEGPLQLQVAALDYSSYVGAIGIGRISRGTLRRGMNVTQIDRDGKCRAGRIIQILGFLGLERTEVESAEAGDIIAFAGLEEPHISDTITAPEAPDPLLQLTVDEPTISMSFEVNSSPFAGEEGRFVTSRELRARLWREILHNVALRVQETPDPDRFEVSGRGELHLGILIETMRREGYEVAVSRPRPLFREGPAGREEPYETLIVDIPDSHQGVVLEALGLRGGSLEEMQPDGRGRLRLTYRIPARGLIGFQTEFRMATGGTGILHRIFEGYGPEKGLRVTQRASGALISNGTGETVPFALFNLQERGHLFVAPGERVYAGQIVGLHARENDLTVNPLKAKALTNIRSAGRDENILLTPPLKITLERALEIINDDELVEATPCSIRLRKRLLDEGARRRAQRSATREENSTSG